MRITELFADYGVPFQTQGHKHCRIGWVNTACPFCTGNPGLHLGFCVDPGSPFFNKFVCYRCGGKHTVKAVATLIGVNYDSAKEIIREYGGKSHIPKQQTIVKLGSKPYKWPSGCMPLNERHKKYLIQRNFNPEELERRWSLVGTGPSSRLVTGTGKDKRRIDYKNRILIPIYWNGKEVSFQTRHIRDSKTKYIVCPEDREIIHHKHILYGRQDKWKSRGICVEGVTDVWRLGFYSFATFGIKYTMEQVKVIIKHFKEVVIVFDDDPQAVEQANKLASILQFTGVHASIETITGDPGGMTQEDADYLVRQIMRKVY